MISKPKQNVLRRLNGAESGAELSLICFPYAGGSANLFRPWRNELPSQIALYGVQLPGRDEHLGEACLNRLQPMVDAVVDGIAAMGDKPFAFFGHSMGALLAFETARSLRRRGLAQPGALFVSAMRAPSLLSEREPIHHLAGHEFIQKLMDLAGGIEKLPPGADLMVREPELIALFQPVLRADIAAVDTYEYRRDTPLECPITACYGLDDMQTDMNSVLQWRDETTGRFEAYPLAGGHFFIHSKASELLSFMSDRLQDMVF
jgi:medium-chain acyl-[acyl-carrier-protein] hydrolase